MRVISVGAIVRVRFDEKATTISLLVVLGERADGQKVLLAIKSMERERGTASMMCSTTSSRRSGVALKATAKGISMFERSASGRRRIDVATDEAPTCARWPSSSAPASDRPGAPARDVGAFDCFHRHAAVGDRRFLACYGASVRSAKRSPDPLRSAAPRRLHN